MTNTFDKMEKAQEMPNKDVNTEKTVIPSAAEVDLDQLSDTAVGDKIKYNRESLDGQVVGIKSLQIFSADTTKTPQKSLSKTSEYYPVNIILTYDVENKDGLNHREYLSGCKQFVQRDGSISEHQFWYDGAENQVAKLWEAVAKVKGVEPKNLTPKQFASYCNSGVKAKIKYEVFKNPENNSKVQKNMVEEFVA